MAKKPYPVTPDGHYFLAKERLWRCTNPALPDAERRGYVKKLMQGRLAVKNATTKEETKQARAVVQEAKVQLGERGPVWWDDGSPDVNQYHPKNTIYADWWRSLSEDE